MTAVEPSRWRASDAEREHTVELLNTAFAEGRLRDEELEGRVDRAFAAHTRADLADLLRDLPPPESPRSRRPARRPFGERITAILNSCLCCGAVAGRGEAASKTHART